jgi:dTDP-4-dehydrorhamnose reductase
MTSRIIVTGKNGQLGQELQAIAPFFPQFQFLFTDRDNLDITNPGHVSHFFDKWWPDYCINAAAYTAVDKAETEKDIATKVNADAVKHLAVASAKHSTKLIHISTDYVFDGTASEPYKEDHPTSPVNFYGQTKLLGEQHALVNNPNSIVVRTSWVYSSFGNNFVKTMMRLMAERESLNVVSDQVGSPTYARDLANSIIHIIASDHFTSGIYHYANEGVISWYEFADEIKSLSKAGCNVSPIPTSAYPTPAKRPAYSVMSKDKIKSTFSLHIPGWKESLKHCFSTLNK